MSRGRARLAGRRQALALRAIPVFAHCRVDELQLVDRLMCEVRVPAGRVLLHEGQPADQLLVVVSGRARLSLDGRALGTANSGAAFGGRELRTRTTNAVTLTAETPMVVRAAGAREFRALLAALPLPALVDPPAGAAANAAEELEAGLRGRRRVHARSARRRRLVGAHLQGVRV